jgi:hypothetical protein
MEAVSIETVLHQGHKNLLTRLTNKAGEVNQLIHRLILTKRNLFIFIQILCSLSMEEKSLLISITVLKMLKNSISSNCRQRSINLNRNINHKRKMRQSWLKMNRLLLSFWLLKFSHHHNNYWRPRNQGELTTPATTLMVELLPAPRLAKTQWRFQSNSHQLQQLNPQLTLPPIMTIPSNITRIMGH